MEIVAAWHGMVDRDLFADNLCRLGYIYNTALIAVEVTGGWGASVITSLRKDNYPNLYRRRPCGDRKSRKRGMSYGWETTQKTRAEMLDSLEQALRDDDWSATTRCSWRSAAPSSTTTGSRRPSRARTTTGYQAAAGSDYLFLHEPGRGMPRRDPESRPWKPLTLTAGY